MQYNSNRFLSQFVLSFCQNEMSKKLSQIEIGKTQSLKNYEINLPISALFLNVYVHPGRLQWKCVVLCPAKIQCGAAQLSVALNLWKPSCSIAESFLW